MWLVGAFLNVVSSELLVSGMLMFLARFTRFPGWLNVLLGPYL